MELETAKEKLLVYMYKDWDNYQALVHPGLRYVYFRRSWSDHRTKINEGSLAVSNARIVKPRTGNGPNYTFSVSL
ncbi:MAG: hypothetical protein H6765_03485 [Candidatus Peribacteria bacterium]|nr:MAG: hypothetical protein H6765_03485 [Candidatus Peribacteria bacterium]